MTRYVTLAHGDTPGVYRQSLMLLLSLVAHAPEPYELVVATDRPDCYVWFGTRVEIEYLDAARFEAWRGPQPFSMREKLELARAAIPHEGSGLGRTIPAAVVLLDADVLALKPLNGFVERLHRGDLFMHKQEYVLSRSRRRENRKLWASLRRVSAEALAARGAGPAAFGERCIPTPPHRAENARWGPRAGGVAPPSNTPGILSRHALPTGRLARLGATPDLHHGLPGQGGFLDTDAMWNSGVLAVPTNDRALLDSALELYDSLGAAGVRHFAAEQLVEGIVLGRTGRLRPAEEWFAHYWGNKPAYDAEIARRLADAFIEGMSVKEAAEKYRESPIDLPVEVRQTRRQKLAQGIGSQR